MTPEVRRIPGEASLADAHAVRRAVFIEEQDVPEAEEMDGRDEVSVHFVAYVSAGTDDSVEPDSDGGRYPVGTARLRIPTAEVAKPERVAVRESYRGQGIGRQLMQAVENEAREQGCERARLHAQTTVEAFYRRLGYETTSGVFEEANIPHVEMERRL